MAAWITTYTETTTDALVKDDIIRITTPKGMVTGRFFSINSKGINFYTSDGKFTSRSINSRVELQGGHAETEDAAPVDEAHDGMSTRELAELVGTDPKSLRVALRALGLGVGKGRKYSLSANTLTVVRAHLATNA